MKIQPLGNIIQLEIEEAKAGILDTSSRDSAVEYAKVIAIADLADDLAVQAGRKYKPEVGDYVFVKAWAIDIINHQDKKYYFVNLDTNGVLAVVK